jgi:hypothetical protein
MMEENRVLAKCPQCQANLPAEVTNTVDVGKDPDLKRRFLGGQINAIECPGCGFQGMLSAPLLYHDPDKELLLSYMPPDLDLQADQREMMLGEMVNRVMVSLPAERRKGYLLQPKSFLTLDSLIQEVLRAEGIDEEAIARQRAGLQLIESLAGALDDEEAFQQMVSEHQDEIDYQFFLLLTAAIESAQSDEDRQRVERLGQLRERLSQSRPPAVPASELPRDLPGLVSYVIEKAESEKDARKVAAEIWPLLDYGFFQTLTARIEQKEQEEDAEGSRKLKELRAQLLEVREAKEKEANESLKAASEFLQQLMDSEDPRSTVQANPEKVDSSLLTILAANEEAAREAGNEELSGKFRELMDLILQRLEEDMPPSLRLLNRLLREERPEEIQAMLEENRSEITSEWVDALKSIKEDLEAQGQNELADKVETIADKATDMMKDES